MYVFKLMISLSMALLFFGEVLAAPVNAQKSKQNSIQTSPTKEDTVKFISQKVGMVYAEKEQFGDGIKKWLAVSKFTDGDCTLKQEINQLLNDDIKERVYHEIDLSKINPSKTSAMSISSNDILKFFYGYQNPASVVIMSTFEKQDIIKVTTSIFKNGDLASEKNKNINQIYVFTPDVDSAARVAKALKHLIALCGGKDEMF